MHYHDVYQENRCEESVNNQDWSRVWVHTTHISYNASCNAHASEGSGQVASQKENFRQQTCAAAWLSSTARSAPEFPMPTTMVFFPRNFSAFLYSQLWRYWPLNLWIPVGKNKNCPSCGHYFIFFNRWHILKLTTELEVPSIQTSYLRIYCSWSAVCACPTSSERMNPPTALF